MRHLRVLLSIIFLFAIAGTAAAQELKTSDCLDCHNDSSLTKDVNGKPVSVFVPKDQFSASVHGVLDCRDCHADVKAYPHEPVPAKVNCASCHSDEMAAYQRSYHAKARANGDQKAATCLDCHGAPHMILPSSNANSPTSHLHIPDTCGRCHGVKFVMEESGIGVQPFLSYKESVHGRAVAKGDEKAATCADCHGTHEILSARESTSSISKFNVPQTCGKCHGAIAKEYSESVHGKAIARGNWQSPVCTDCHGIHTIKSPVDPQSSVTAQAVARSTCAQCHGGVKLSREFGVAAGRVSSYLDSYHGLAATIGSEVAANCASCHGVHNILPSSDPRSTINKQNLAKTCGKCHPGAGENFTKGKVHLIGPEQKDIGTIVIDWIRRFYLVIIISTIGLMVLHNVLSWWILAVKARKRGDRVVLRMTKLQRIQHFLMLTSFIVLVITGFALKYPSSWLALLMGGSETFRRLGHRGAAIVMIGVSIYHVLWAAFTKEGRQAIIDMFPRWKDAQDVLGMARYFLGRGPHPQFAKFNYVEKSEYWALVWGTIVMAVTGLMLWYKVGVGTLVPRWWVDVALTIHWYEAILATLAIIVWHFYSVIFSPDIYPMNWAWFDGRMSVEQYQHEHPLAYKEWLEERRAAGDAEEKAEEEEKQPQGE